MPTPMSSAYQDAYDSLLRELEKNPGANPETMAAFWPMSGHGYHGDLMVIGQATNGWEGQIDVQQLKYPDYRTRVMKKARAVADSGICNLATRCPMLWVTDQWQDKRKNATGKSPFWRVIREVVDRLNLGDVNTDDWPSALAWSNLYKVAPKDGGNPVQRFRAGQEPGVFDLLKREVEEFAPRRVLVLTGLDLFAPFAAHAGLALIPESGPVVEAHAIVDNTHWIVARYPSRLPKDLTEIIFADYIARAFWRQSG